MARKKLSVPGSIYRNKNRYWWKVALPGESLAKSRPLKPRGGRYATTDYNVAVEVAREMWQQALFHANQIDETDNSVAGLVQAYLHHCRGYYRLSNEAEQMLHGLTCVVDLCSSLSAEDFGPKDLKAVRQSLIDRRLARTTVNKYVGMVKRMFDWAVEEERVPASVAYGLRCVSSLRRGRSAAKETKPIKPVADEHVYAVLPHATGTIAAMIELQLLTGMRSSELCQIRPHDVDMSAMVWLYTPQRHKTQHLNRERVIAIGPKGQGLLGPFLLRNADAYCSAQRNRFSRCVIDGMSNELPPYHVATVPAVTAKHSHNGSPAIVTTRLATAERSSVLSGLRRRPVWTFPCGRRCSCVTAPAPAFARSSVSTWPARLWAMPMSTQRRSTPSWHEPRRWKRRGSWADMVVPASWRRDNTLLGGPRRWFFFTRDSTANSPGTANCVMHCRIAA